MTAEEMRIKFWGDGDSRAYSEDETDLMEKYADQKVKEVLNAVKKDYKQRQTDGRWHGHWFTTYKRCIETIKSKLK